MIPTETLIDDLTSGPWQDAARAVSLLAVRDEPAALRALENAVNGDDAVVAAKAAAALGKRGNQQAVDALTEALYGEKRRASTDRYVASLKKNGNALASLPVLMHDESEIQLVQVEAAKALASIGGHKAERALKQAAVIIEDDDIKSVMEHELARLQKNAARKDVSRPVSAVAGRAMVKHGLAPASPATLPALGAKSKVKAGRTRARTTHNR